MNIRQVNKEENGTRLKKMNKEKEMLCMHVWSKGL